jgi:hypothetical protein
MDFWLGIAVVIATLLGPVSAVFVTRWIDAERDQRNRRMEVFRSMMGARRAPLSPERVRALNMVEIEFHGVKLVEAAYRDLFQHLHTSSQVNREAWQETSRKLSTRLLTEIAKVLGYKLQQLDVLDGGYYPQGFADIETEQQAVRRLLIELLSNKRPISVSPAIASPPAPFPPPPPPPQPKTDISNPFEVRVQ